MNIGKQRRTIYIEPIEEPSALPGSEPSLAVDPEPSEPIAEPHPEPAG